MQTTFFTVLPIFPQEHIRVKLTHVFNIRHYTSHIYFVEQYPGGYLLFLVVVQLALLLLLLLFTIIIITIALIFYLYLV